MLDVEESSFLMTEEVFLGYRLNSNGISVNQENLNKIRDLPIPMNATDVKSFLALIDQFAAFLPNFDELAAPLHRLTHPDFVFYWSWIEQKAFDNIKRGLIYSSAMPFNNLISGTKTDLM